MAQIFDININEEYYNSKPAYKLVHGFYDDGGIQFPYAFEILVAPYRHPLQHDTIFIGAINYSVSPLSNKFEGYYCKDSGNNPINNISKLLEGYGFYHGFTTPVETLYQEPLQDLLTFINEFYNDLIDDKLQEIQDQLSNIQGMLDINEKQEEIQNELQQKVDDDDTVKTLIIPTIEILLAELKRKVKEKEKENKEKLAKRAADE